MRLNLDRAGKKVVLLTSLSFLAFLLFLRFSGFSTASVVNFYNHIIKSVIFSASTDTFNALGMLLRPFAFVVMSLVFLTLAIAILAYFGSRKDVWRAGIISGFIGALFAVVLFPTLAGVFLAIALLSCSYASRFSGMYAREMKKWVNFRVGSSTAGKTLLIVNIIISLGVFSSILASQAKYESSFKEELKESVRTLALSLPGASSMSPEMLDERVESTTASLTGSKFFGAYITWLPVSAAFTTWIILEFLRNLVFANLGGLFTYLMLKKRQSYSAARKQPG